MAVRSVARLGDPHVCPVHGSNPIVTGSRDILVNNRPLARVGDRTACGATILTGVTTRVVPLDNFMIYKDIIRLDRPD